MPASPGQRTTHCGRPWRVGPPRRRRPPSSPRARHRMALPEVAQQAAQAQVAQALASDEPGQRRVQGALPWRAARSRGRWRRSSPRARPRPTRPEAMGEPRPRGVRGLDEQGLVRAPAERVRVRPGRPWRAGRPRGQWPRSFPQARRHRRWRTPLALAGLSARRLVWLALSAEALGEKGRARARFGRPLRAGPPRGRWRRSSPRVRRRHRLKRPVPGALGLGGRALAASDGLELAASGGWEGQPRARRGRSRKGSGPTSSPRRRRRKTRRGGTGLGERGDGGRRGLDSPWLSPLVKMLGGPRGLATNPQGCSP